MKVIRILPGLFFLVISSLALAHHATVTNFTQEIIKVNGTIVEVRYQNPHSSILIKRPAENINDSDGIEYWLIETSARNTLESQGITLDTLSANTKVKVTGRKGRRPYTIFLQKMVLENGEVFTANKSE